MKINLLNLHLYLAKIGQSNAIFDIKMGMLPSSTACKFFNYYLEKGLANKKSLRDWHKRKLHQSKYLKMTILKSSIEFI